MADSKISQLPVAPAPITGAELLPIVQNGITYQATVANLASGVAATNVKSYGAVGDGVTDDSVAIQNAINAVSGVVNGGILFFPPGDYMHNSVITLMDNVILEGYGAVLSWGGAAGVQIDTASTGVTLSVGIVGMTISGGSATTLVSLRSAWSPIMRDVTFSSGIPTSTCLALSVNTSGSVNGDGNRNFAFGTFDNLLQEGSCGTFISMTGDATGPTVITLNTFSNLNAQSCAVYGINIVSWTDSNTFTGMTRVSMASGTTSIGVVYNSGSPTANAGVYANNFEHLAVDTFGVSTNQIGLKFNYTKDNRIGYFFQDPVADGGDFVVTSDCLSYDVMHQVGATSTMVHKVLGQSMRIGPVGSSATWSLGGMGYKQINYQFDAASVFMYGTGTYYIGTTTASPIIFSPGSAEKLRASETGVITMGGTSLAPAMKVVPVASQTSWVEATGSSTALPSVAASSGTLVFPSLNSFGKATAPTCGTDTTSFASKIVTNTAATYTVLTTDSTIVQTTAASTYALPDATLFPGRKLHILTQFAGAVISNASNVVPLAGGAAGTAILAATAGKWALLQSNGTNWLIVAAN